MLILIILAAALLLAVAHWLEWKPIDNWRRRIFREWSTRIQALGMSIMTLVPFDPVTGLGFWNMMPDAVQAAVPYAVLFPAGIGLFVLAWLAKYVKQEALHGEG